MPMFSPCQPCCTPPPCDIYVRFRLVDTFGTSVSVQLTTIILTMAKDGVGVTNVPFVVQSSDSDGTVVLKLPNIPKHFMLEDRTFKLTLELIPPCYLPLPLFNFFGRCGETTDLGTIIVYKIPQKNLSLSLDYISTNGIKTFTTNLVHAAADHWIGQGHYTEILCGGLNLIKFLHINSPLPEGCRIVVSGPVFYPIEFWTDYGCGFSNRPLDGCFAKSDIMFTMALLCKDRRYVFLFEGGIPYSGCPPHIQSFLLNHHVIPKLSHTPFSVEWVNQERIDAYNANPQVFCLGGTQELTRVRIHE